MVEVVGALAVKAVGEFLPVEVSVAALAADGVVLVREVMMIVAEVVVLQPW